MLVFYLSFTVVLEDLMLMISKNSGPGYEFKLVIDLEAMLICS